jgi:hypothetical protein
MAVLNWLPRALARAMVFTIVVTAYDVTTTYSVTINGKSISTLGTGGTTGTTATALQALLDASEIPEFAAITWTVNSSTITGTVDTAGVPVVVTTSESGGTGTIGDPSTTTAATGPYHLNDVLNWDTGALPGNGDTANINLDLGSILYELDALDAVTLAELNIFSGGITQNVIGLGKSNPGGWPEYLPQNLAVGATDWVVECGSPRVNLDFGSVAGEGEIRRTGQSTDGLNTPAVLVKGTSGSNTLDVNAGRVGLAYHAGESYVGSSLKVSPNAAVRGGAGAVVSAIDSAGNLDWGGTYADLRVTGGTATIRGTQAATSTEAAGGQTILRAAGNFGDVVIGPGSIDASQDLTPRTFATTVFERGGSLRDDGSITHTGGIEVAQGVGLVSAA